MTSIIMFRRRESASILTDAAAYDAEGIVKGFGIKCVPLPHLRAALATRGTSLMTSVLAANLGFAFQTFDDMVQNGGAAANEWFEQFSELITSGESEVQVFLAGWSETSDRPRTFILQSMANNEYGLEPWVFHECEDPVFGAPLPDERDLEAQGLDLSIDPSKVDPRRHGLQIMEAQRLMTLGTLTGGDGKEANIVGGFALLTEIDQSGVRQSVIHRWKQDEIGKRIDPHKVVTQPSTSSQMTRQQRRAFERVVRKERVMS